MEEEIITFKIKHTNGIISDIVSDYQETQHTVLNMVINNKIKEFKEFYKRDPKYNNWKCFACDWETNNLEERNKHFKTLEHDKKQKIENLKVMRTYYKKKYVEHIKKYPEDKIL